MIQKLTYGYRSAFVCLLVVLGVLMVPILADEEQGGGGVVVGPEGEHSPAHGAHQRVVTCKEMPFRTWFRI